VKFQITSPTRQNSPSRANRRRRGRDLTTDLTDGHGWELFIREIREIRGYLHRLTTAGRKRGQRSARRRINSRVNRGMAWSKRVHRSNAPIRSLSKNKTPSATAITIPQTLHYARHLITKYLHHHNSRPQPLNLRDLPGRCDGIFEPWARRQLLFRLWSRHTIVVGRHKMPAAALAQLWIYLRRKFAWNPNGYTWQHRNVPMRQAVH